jgi:oxaloacetate decarboxylase beta subunit
MRAVIDGMGISHLTVGQLVMILVAMGLIYLAIVRKYEPLLLLPLAFGILIANIPYANLSAYDTYTVLVDGAEQVRPGLMNFLYNGIIYVIYPPMIFLCIGTMTDFGPLIAAPRNALIGLGGQLGIFVSFALALYLTPFIPGFEGFTVQEAAAIGIIGSSDGPTSIFSASRLAPHLLPPIAIAAFTYMAFVPFIQPPIMRALTNEKERVIEMPEPKRITQKQKIVFPIAMTAVILLLVPAAGALIGMLMLGNLLKESGVTERFIRTLQDALLNILTLLVALSIGSSATADRFLTPQTIIIVFLGLLAFIFGTIGGVLVAKLMCALTKGKVNPLIGNAGVSAMPMAARISQKMGQRYNPNNHLLMHAMGPLVSSTIGSALIAGIFISVPLG